MISKAPIGTMNNVFGHIIDNAGANIQEL